MMIKTITDADYPPPPKPQRRAGKQPLKPLRYLPFCNSQPSLMNFRKPINLRNIIPGKKEQPDSWALEPMER